MCDLSVFLSHTLNLSVSRAHARALPLFIPMCRYDLSRWRKAHPAGTHWIDLYKDRDATEVMYGFHSGKAMDMIKRLPKSKTTPDLEKVPLPSQTTMNFRKWRADLVEQGWFKRDWRHEAFNLGSWAVWLTAGIMLAQFHTLQMQFLAATVLGISNTIAGWLSHDYVHGRGKWADFMRPFGHICGGMSPTWWSDKHNVHHARTNEVGIDEDIATDPALFLWSPFFISLSLQRIDVHVKATVSLYVHHVCMRY